MAEFEYKCVPVPSAIEVGKKADMVIFDIPNHHFLPYQFGVNLVSEVIKNGILVVKNG